MNSRIKAVLNLFKRHGVLVFDGKKEDIGNMGFKYDPWSAHSFLTSEELIEFYNQYDGIDIKGK